jgi:type II secretory pathway pseudopilin PulG
LTDSKCVADNGEGASQTAGSTAAAGKKLDLSFIPEDAVAVAVVRPHRALASPQAELYPTEVLSLAGKKYFGFDPADLEEGIAVFGLPDPAVENAHKQPRLGFILRFDNSVDVASVARKIVPEGNDAEIEGRMVRTDRRPDGTCCTPTDQHTLLVSDRIGLPWMLAGKEGVGAIQKLLAAADDSPDAAAYVVVEPLRPFLRPVIAQAKRQLPPPLMNLTKIPDQVETLTMEMKQIDQGNMRFELIAAAADEIKARELEKSLKQLLEIGRAMFLSQVSKEMARNTGEDPEVANAMMHYVARLSNKFVTAAQPLREGNRVIFRRDSQFGIASVGVLTSLLLPAVQAARDAARRNESANNLKQTALAILNYEAANRRLPAQANYDAQGKPLLSWRVLVLPYQGEEELYKQFHLDEPWDSEHNKALIEKMPDVYKHPAFNAPGKTLYQAVVGKGLAFEGKEGLLMYNFVDGTSRTIMVVEASPDKAVPWTKPEDWEMDPNNPLKGLGGLFAGNIFQVVFVDGHVQAIPRSIDPALFKAALTRDGRETLP